VKLGPEEIGKDIRCVNVSLGAGEQSDLLEVSRCKNQIQILLSLL